MARSAPHACGRNLRRDLMYIDKHGCVVSLSSSGARRWIKSAGSVRKAARELGIPKSTLHDCARDINKLRSRG